MQMNRVLCQEAPDSAGQGTIVQICGKAGVSAALKV